MGNFFKEHRFIFQNRAPSVSAPSTVSSNPANTETVTDATSKEQEKRLLKNLSSRIRSAKDSVTFVLDNWSLYTPFLITSAKRSKKDLESVEKAVNKLTAGGDVTGSELSRFTTQLGKLENHSSDLSIANVFKNASLKTKLDQQRQALKEKTDFTAERLWEHLGFNSATLPPKVQAAVKSAFDDYGFKGKMTDLITGAKSELDEIGKSSIIEDPEVATRLVAVTKQVTDMTLDNFGKEEHISALAKTVDSLKFALIPILNLGGNGKYCTDAKSDAESEAVFALENGESDLFDTDSHRSNILSGHATDVLNANRIMCTPDEMNKALSKPLGAKRSESEQSIVDMLMSKRSKLQKAGIIIPFSGDTDSTSYKLSHKLDWHKTKSQEFKTLKALLDKGRLQSAYGDNSDINDNMAKIDQYIGLVENGNEKAVNRFIRANKTVFTKGGSLFDAASCVRRSLESKRELTKNPEATLNTETDYVFINRSPFKGKDLRRRGLTLTADPNYFPIEQEPAPDAVVRTNTPENSPSAQIERWDIASKLYKKYNGVKAWNRDTEDKFEYSSKEEDPQEDDFSVRLSDGQVYVFEDAVWKEYDVPTQYTEETIVDMKSGRSETVIKYKDPRTGKTIEG